jgi:aarF domain-containing kinase
MMAALVHLGLGEWSRLVEDLNQMDLLKPETDMTALALDLEKEFAVVLNGGIDPGSAPSQLPLLSLQNSQLSFSTLTAVLFKVAYKYRFLLPPYFPLVVRSVSSLEGIALCIDPNFKLISAGMPIVLTQVRRRLHQHPQLELQHACPEHHSSLSSCAAA